MFEKLGSKLKEQKGFTLIELLAVIVILGIIAAIAIPAIGNVITKSDNKAKVQDALLILNAAKLYVADNRDTVSDSAASTLTLTGTTELANSIALNSYLDRVKDSSFVVTVTPSKLTDGTVKYTYSISKHEAVDVSGVTTTGSADAKVATEKALTSFLNPQPTQSTN
jgi:type IV pilus assembly protein PilA